MHATVTQSIHDVFAADGTPITAPPADGPSRRTFTVADPHGYRSRARQVMAATMRVQLVLKAHPCDEELDHAARHLPRTPSSRQRSQGSTWKINASP